MNRSDTEFILPTSSFLSAEAVGLEPTSEMDSPPVFKTGPSSSRMTSGSVAFRSAKERPFSEKKATQAAVAGIEPASGRLTAACPYQHGPHRKGELSVVSF